MLDKQQITGSISSSTLSGCALRENNLAPRFESKTQSPKVPCFHTSFDLYLVFSWTLGHTSPPLSHTHLLLPPISISFLSLHLLVFFPQFLFPSFFCCQAFICPLFNHLNLTGMENAPCICTKARTVRRIWEGVWNLNSPPTPPLWLSLCLEVRGYLPTISQPITTLTGPYWFLVSSRPFQRTATS